MWLTTSYRRRVSDTLLHSGHPGVCAWYEVAGLANDSQAPLLLQVLRETVRELV